MDIIFQIFQVNFRFSVRLKQLTYLERIIRFDLHLFYKQLRSGPSPQSCLFFQDFQGSKLLKDCLVVCSNKQILSVFQLFFSTHH